MFISDKGVESLSIMKNKLLTKKLNAYLEYVKDFVDHQRHSVDDIHTLRVNSRELSSLIRTDHSFYTQLKKLIKASNTLRDMDVFVDIYLKSLPKKLRIKLDIKSIKKSVKKKRRKRIDKLHTYLKSLAIPKSVIFNEVDKTQSLDMNKDLPALEQTALHKYRIYIKKRLYNEKNCIPRDEQKVKTLTKIKDLLGNINDNYNGLKQLSRYNIKPKLYDKVQAFTEKENLRLYIAFKEVGIHTHKKWDSTMKRLYIIRHAKSSWKDESLYDFDRPLNKRGKQNAPLMGNRLRDKNIKPDLIISSPALRAKTTAEIIAKLVRYNKNIIFDERVYEATPAELHAIVTETDDKNSVLFFVGHNPGLNMLTEEYVHLDENIVTCGIIEIAFDCDRWADISARNARLISFDYPKKHD